MSVCGLTSHQSEFSIGELLRSNHILNPEKGIIVFGEANTIRLQLPRQPFVAVQIDLDGHGKPGLNTYMDQAEVTIHEVEVQVQTLPPCGFNERTLIRAFFLEQERKVRHGSRI